MIDKSARVYKPCTILEDKNHQVSIGPNCSVGQYVFIAARKFQMLEGSEIGVGAIVSGGGAVYIKKHAVVDFGARLIPASDRPEARFMCSSKPESERKVIRGSIIVGEGAYIGTNAVICVTPENRNIVVGDFAVVGALTYIDKDVPPRTIIHQKQILWDKPRWPEERENNGL